MSPILNIVIPSRGPSELRQLLEHDLQRELDGAGAFASVHIEEGSSASANRNAGASVGEAPWICFLDDDVRLPLGWIKEVETVLIPNPPYDLFSGLIESTHPRNILSQAAEDFVVRHKRYGAQLFLVGAMLFVRRTAFDVIGGFDESFQGAGGEDWDFCSRAHQLHMRVGIIDSIRCAHENPRTFTELMRRAASYGSSEPQPAKAMIDNAKPRHTATKSPLMIVRAATWPIREYRNLRNRGRTRTRSLVSTSLYVPWMARYLWARRSNVAP